MDLHPVADYLMNAGMGLRLLQAFSRSIPCPDASSGRTYRFFFTFTQQLLDNKDRLADCTHASVPSETK